MKCMFINISHRSTWITKENFKCCRQRCHAGGGGLMYWSMLIPNGIIALKKIMRNLNSDEYINLLKHYAVPLMKLNRIENFKFIQYNCPAYKSRKTTKFVKDYNIYVLEWSVRSLDINLTEDIWVIISNIV